MRKRKVGGDVAETRLYLHLEMSCCADRIMFSIGREAGGCDGGNEEIIDIVLLVLLVDVILSSGSK